MVDTYTSGKLGLIEPARGAYVDTWDEPLYANWQTLEACISGTTTLTLTSSNVVLTVPTYPTYSDPPTVSTSAQNLRLLLQGTPTVNLIIYIPQTISGFWFIDNQTTGTYTVTVKTTAAGSTGVVPRKGGSSVVYSDGTNIYYADGGTIQTYIDTIQTIAPGTILPFGGLTAPSGYLACDGASYLSSNYANLFAAIGYTWGGSGSNFNVPDLRNMFLRGSGTSAVGTYEADDFKSHTHAITDPGHRHAVLPNYIAVVSGGGQHYDGNGYGTAYYQTESATTGITNQSTGGTETRPVNKRVLYMIKT